MGPPTFYLSIEIGEIASLKKWIVAEIDYSRSSTMLMKMQKLASDPWFSRARRRAIPAGVEARFAWTRSASACLATFPKRANTIATL
jgi:hypothetical protein